MRLHKFSAQSACALLVNWLLAICVTPLLIFSLSAQVAQARELPAIAPKLECTSLVDKLFKAGDDPVRITSAKVKDQGVTSPYCEVQGYVAPQVRFELRLPQSSWHQRLLFTGCGGICGMVSIRPGMAFGCAPLDNGEFALVSSDLGHNAPFFDGIWATDNPNGIRDFGHRGAHVVTLAARALITAYYGQAPQYSYFTGCSDGGREAMMEAQRYPGDFDGIVAGAPVINQTANNSVYHAWLVQHLLAPDRKPLLEDAVLARVHAEVLAQCDALDGAKDGLITDPSRCHPSFARLECRAKAKAGCIRTDQIAAIQAVYAGPKSTDGQPLYPGAPAGSETSWNKQATGSELFARNFITYMTGEKLSTEIDVWKAGYDVASIARYNRNAADLNATNPDLGAFAAKGGKLILWHGSADASVPAGNSIAYFADMRAKMGQSQLSAFLKFYLLPGVGHCGGGDGPDRVNFLNPIMAWVEDGIAPGTVTATSAANAKLQKQLAPYTG